MVGYLKKERELINLYKRKLMTFEEVTNRLYGYLECMVDNELLPEDRLSDEFAISVHRLIESRIV